MIFSQCREDPVSKWGLFLSKESLYNDIMGQLANVNIGITSWELIILLFLIGGGFLLGLLLGRDKLFLMLLASYISSALLSIVPLEKMLPEFFRTEENFVVLIVLYLVLIGIIYFILLRSFSRSSARKNKSIFQIFFFSVFLIGIVLSIVFLFLPQDLISAFSPLTLRVFDTSLARVLWFVVPLIFVGIFKRSAN